MSEKIDPYKIDLPDTIEGWRDLMARLSKLDPADARPVFRLLCRTNLYFLLRYACHRKDMEHPWLLDRCNEVNHQPDGYLDLWAREHYKPLAVTTPVLTTRGWKAHGDLEPGDMVFTPSGLPTQVIANTGTITDAECYEVEFDDGTKIIAGGGHLWRLQLTAGKRLGKKVRKEDVLTTKEVMESLGRNPRIPVARPVQCENSELLVDPYVLGAWIGDGSTASGVICGADQHVFDEVRRAGYEVASLKYKENASTGNRCYYATVYGLGAKLRELGVLNNKHIPERYLIASQDQRLRLLHGLIDTDGHVTNNRNHGVTFATKYLGLAEQVQYLACSLGYKAKLYPVRGTGTWHVAFAASALDEIWPASTPLKTQRLKPIQRHPRSQHRYIRAIRPVDTVPVNCIQVASEDGCYLADRTLVTTHNSTIITFGKTLQDILASHGDDPLPQWTTECTIGIFSHTRPIARQFLRQLKYEMEGNDLLKEWFPDVLWKNPKENSPKWSEDDGLVVRRRSNPKESTVEAWGLTDGQPTSKHFLIMVYDDVVTISSVSTPDMIAKTTSALELSYNLGARGGVRRFIGTRYHFNDSYREIMKRQSATPRIYPATVDGTPEGEPVLFDKESIQQKRRDQGPYTFACQQLQNPRADENEGFKDEWLRFYHGDNDGGGMNRYILVDPANEKKAGSDYTAIWVIGLGQDGNYYALDMYRDRLNLGQRADLIFRLHRKWRPRRVGYEKYGMQADIQHLQDRMRQENYRFEITPLGGQTKKSDRIKRLLPIFQEGRMYLPESDFKTDYEGRMQDLVDAFINEEYKPFPVAIHDDMLDALSRIADPDFPVVWPQPEFEEGDRYQRAARRAPAGHSSWMAV